MTAVPEDHWLLGVRPRPVTAEEYDALPEDVSRTIEIVDGQVVFCASPTPEHQRAARRLANLIERWTRSAKRSGHGRLSVNNGLDLRLCEVPLLNRRPDVLLYRCLDRRNGERLRAAHVLLVAEVVAPGSETSDTAHKFMEYAKAGIPHYWVVRLDGRGVSMIERYALDRAAMLYKHLDTLMRDEAGGPPEIAGPIAMTIEWDELEY